MSLENKTFCLVTGCPRSGTTAMMRLLNTHPEVAICNERYFSAVAQDDFGRGHFRRDRMSSFEEGDGYPEAMTAVDTVQAIELAEKAQVFGDKVPNVEAVVKAARRLGGVKVIAMVRDPIGVILSFEDRRRRAVADPDGDPAWPAHFDFEEGMKRFNHAMSHLLKETKMARDRRGYDLLIVDYAEIFSAEGDLNRIFSFIGVDPRKAETATEIQTELDADRQGVNKILRDASLHAAFGKYRAVMNHAVVTEGAHC